MGKFEKVFYVLSWVSLVATILSFFGIFGSHDLVSLGFSFIVPLPDFTIIGFGALTILFGVLSAVLSGYHGKGPAIAGAICIVLSFTTVANITQLLGYGFHETNKQLQSVWDPSEYAELTEDEYGVYAFLGSKSSKPEDHDILEYRLYGYDGHAKGEYKKLKVCGYIFPEGDNWGHFQKIVVEVVLIDADGNDILLEGEPVLLTAQTKGGPAPKFETNVINAKELPVQPYSFRVERVLVTV